MFGVFDKQSFQDMFVIWFKSYDISFLFRVFVKYQQYLFFLYCFVDYWCYSYVVMVMELLFFIFIDLIVWYQNRVFLVIIV